MHSSLHCEIVPDDVRNAENAASKALQNIQSLYNEIMQPIREPEIECTRFECSTDSPSFNRTRRNTPSGSWVEESRPKLSSNSELCKKCRKKNSRSSLHFSSDTTEESQRPSSENAILNNDKSYQLRTTVKKSSLEYKVTVPKPFSLTEKNVQRQEAKELKLAKLKEEQEKEKLKELNIKFSSKPVPKHVHLPLYEEMLKKSEVRKTERKEKCSKIVNDVKHRSFLSKSALNLFSQSHPDLSNCEFKMFKAKPVPKNILSENVSKKLKDKEEIRKILAAQRAEKLLKESALPFSPRKIPRSQSWLSLSDCPKNNVTASKETIDAITKRLYTIKCKETIENWNNKVLNNSVDELENISNNYESRTNHSIKSTKSYSSYPFSYYPVRKTSATLKREKQIRSDMELKEIRRNKDELLLLDISQKKKQICEKIWPRLKVNEPSMNSDKEIEEKVKIYKASIKCREKEYEKELEEMMERVSNRILLIERQSKTRQEMPAVDSSSDVTVCEKGATESMSGSVESAEGRSDGNSSSMEQTDS